MAQRNTKRQVTLKTSEKHLETVCYFLDNDTHRANNACRWRQHVKKLNLSLAPLNSANLLGTFEPLENSLQHEMFLK